MVSDLDTSNRPKPPLNRQDRCGRHRSAGATDGDTRSDSKNLVISGEAFAGPLVGIHQHMTASALQRYGSPPR
ncbi:hypothetical protein [Lysobacter gummosus]|uniref:hypothetical protein n=1 Tax=Lysobacter gummosus TaxID=262324 RepID=UPI00362CD4DB